MILQCGSLYGAPPSPTSSVCTQSHKQLSLVLHQLYSFRPIRNTKAPKFRVTCLGAGLLDNIAQLAHNKVLVAACASAAIGQLSKPFTSVLLYGKDFDIKETIQAGGFPSTHSSAMVASATSIGLERGFNDSIFGLTVVYAGLVMYDAQGVRREVGNHAITLNQILPTKSFVNSKHSKGTDGVINCKSGISSPMTVGGLDESILSEKAAPFGLQPTNTSVLLASEDRKRQTNEQLLSSSFSPDSEAASETINANSLAPLKESIGHTEVEVIAGALLGFLVGLSVYTII
ncbi:Acid phosphatase/vanadium-dependent haloperoxidase-related protein [Quillaja saponaria]|uniref:Acid phosphatase/vanadium-dependent haloperoxidase-related protein n=1 Tax=Quillaja saponaria TaxID=32244 RepID=A0AAD7PBR4_QUISA|nr:Acid phosphatase/vanadium-dependent haloperoxidase-related protein [Quillaja saponaria]